MVHDIWLSLAHRMNVWWNGGIFISLHKPCSKLHAEELIHLLTNMWFVYVMYDLQWSFLMLNQSLK